MIDQQKPSRQFKRALALGYYPLANTPMAGVGAGINRRTGQPHENAREIARNNRRSN